MDSDVKHLREKYDDKRPLSGLMDEESCVEFERLYTHDVDIKNLVGDAEAFTAAARGDFSRFEKVSGCARVYLATRFWNQITRDSALAGGYPEADDPGMTDILEQYAKNPLFRLAISVRGGGEQNAERDAAFIAYDDYMNAQIMKQSLEPFSKEAFDRYQAALGGDYAAQSAAIDDFADNIDKQVIMAKVLLLGAAAPPQIITTTESGVQSHTYEGRFANLLAHCSRISVELPRALHGNGEFAEVSPIKSMMGEVTKSRGDKSGIYKRSAATHDVQKRVTRDGKVVKPYKEIKGTTFTDQYGMDVAIGGLGNDGISGQMLRGDGTSGHMFLHAEDGFGAENGAMLIGFESDSPSAEGNQQGHTHTVFATPEKMSSFLGSRTNELGDKYGGRYLDLSKTNAQTFDRFMSEFEAAYRNLALECLDADAEAVVNAEVDAGDPLQVRRKQEAERRLEARGRLASLNDMLCGKRLDSVQLAQTLVGLGMDRATVCTMISDVRREEVAAEMSHEGVQRDGNAEFLYLMGKTGNVHVASVTGNGSRPPFGDKSRSAEYRHRLTNSVRRGAGLPEKHMLQTAERQRINEGYMSDLINASRDIVQAGLEPDRYPAALQADKVYFEKAEACCDNLDNLDEAARPAAKALADGLRGIAGRIAEMGIREEAYSLASTTDIRIKAEDAPYLSREEVNAAAKAFADETAVHKAIEIRRFEALNKVYGVLAGSGSMEMLDPDERAYAERFLKEKGITVKQNSYAKSSGDGTFSITLSDTHGLKSLDAWKNAGDQELSALFRNKFLQNPALDSYADMVGKDIYDCLFICNGSDSRSVREYFKDRNLTEEQMQAGYMRLLIKDGASGCMLSFDKGFNPHAAKLQVVSSYEEKAPKARFWSRAAKNWKSSNDRYREAAGHVDESLTDSIKRENTAQMPEEFVKRSIIHTTAKYLRENALEAQKVINQQINEILGKPEGAENEDDFVTSPVEAQLYMLSKGVAFEKVLSTDMTEEKSQLIQEYYSLKAAPESGEYRSAVADMGKTLAAAAPPTGDLGSKDVILGNLREIDWLNRAARLFADGMGADGEMNADQEALSGAIAGMLRVTDEQLKLVDTYVSDDFKKPSLQPQEIRAGLDAKASLARLGAGRKSYDYSSFAEISTIQYGKDRSDADLAADPYALRWMAEDSDTDLYYRESTGTYEAGRERTPGLSAVPAAGPEPYDRDKIVSRMDEMIRAHAGRGAVDEAVLRSDMNELMEGALTVYAQELRQQNPVAGGTARCAFPVFAPEAQAEMDAALEQEKAALADAGKQKLQALAKPEKEPVRENAGKEDITRKADPEPDRKSGEERLGAVTREELAHTDYAYKKSRLKDEIRLAKSKIKELEQDSLPEMTVDKISARVRDTAWRKCLSQVHRDKHHDIQHETVLAFAKKHGIEIKDHHLKSLERYWKKNCTKEEAAKEREEFGKEYESRKLAGAKELYQSPGMQENIREMIGEEIRANQLAVGRNELLDVYRKSLDTAEKDLKKLEEEHSRNQECVTEEKLDALDPASAGRRRGSAKRVEIRGGELVKKETPSRLEELLSPVQESEPHRVESSAERKRPGADAGKSRSMAESGRKSPAADDGKKNVQDERQESKRGKLPGRR